MATITLTNLITNGSFETNVTGWAGYSTNQNGAQSTLAPTRVAKPASPTHTEWGSWVANQGSKVQGVVAIQPSANLTTVIGHKYYLRSRVRLRGSTAGAVTQFNWFHRVAVNGTSIALPGRGSNLQTIANTVSAGLYTTNITEFPLVDDIWTADRTAFCPSLVWAKTSNGNDDQYGQADNIMVIDLTAAFGAGNEPPLGVIRYICQQYTQSGYWDGSANFDSANVPLPPIFDTITLPTALLGRQYSGQITMQAGTGTAPFTFALSGLPSGHGLSVDSTGAVTGISGLHEGSYSVTVTCTDAVGYQVTTTTTIVAGEPPIINETYIPSAIYNQPYSWTPNITGSNGNLTYTIAVTSGTLPTGLSLSNPVGSITGTPTVDEQSCTITVTAYNDFDQVGVTFQDTLDVVSAPRINTTSPIRNGITNETYAPLTFTAGGIQPITWVLLNDLPDGLSFDDQTGILSGTPTVEGTFSFSLRAVNSLGTDTRLYQITINTRPVITTTTLGYGRVGNSYSAQIQATGTQPITYAIISGGLPTGLSINSAGLITGTPQAVGTSNFTVQATNAAGVSTPVNLSIETGFALAITTTSPLPIGTRNQTYTPVTLQSIGSDTTYAISWSWVAQSGSSIPTGLSINQTTGVISGTPTVAGTFSVNITVSNGSNGSATSPFTITIGDVPTITASPTLFGGVDRPFTTNLTATGATPITWRMTGGVVPPTLPDSTPVNITVNSSGIVAWLVPEAGSYSFNVIATNQFGDSAPFQITLTITTPSIIDVYLPNGYIGEPWTYTFTASGLPPFTWTRPSGTLPNGLTWDPLTATVSGTPTTAGTFSFDIQVNNAGGTARETFTITIQQKPLILTPDLNSGNVSASYSQTLTASGTTPITWGILPAGSGETGLPTGLSLTGATISGTPTTQGTYVFTVRASNITPYVDEKQFTVIIGPSGAPIITTTASLSGVRGTAFSQTLNATGNPTIVWSLAGGSTLPDGITLSGNTLSGTPTVSGVFQFTINATNSVDTDARVFTMTIAGLIPVITSTSPLPDGKIAVEYDFQFTADNETPMTWLIATPVGSETGLPLGLSLDVNTGELSGTLEESGDFSFRVRAVNAYGNSAYVAFTLHIKDIDGLYLNGDHVAELYYNGEQIFEAYVDGVKVFDMPMPMDEEF